VRDVLKRSSKVDLDGEGFAAGAGAGVGDVYDGRETGVGARDGIESLGEGAEGDML
jgi:hypothetical protein